MVQDISSPEIYLSRLPDGRCGGWNLYQDQVISTPADIDSRDLRECSVFWAITVPGESRWHAKQLEGPLFSRGEVEHLPSSPDSHRVNYSPRNTFEKTLSRQSPSQAPKPSIT